MKAGISLPTINISNVRQCKKCHEDFPIEGNFHHCIKHRSVRNGKRIQFCALDGEADTTNGSVYVLFAMGNDPDHPLINKNGLTFTEVFEYLYEHYESGIAYVGFFLGYDFNQWFKSLSMERAAMLLTAEGREKRRRRTNGYLGPFPVDYADWEFDILGTKRLKIRPKLCACYREKGKPKCDCEQAKWMYICDVGPFFQTAFINVINPEKWDDPIVTDEEFELILKGKEKRSNAALDDEMIEYNRLENEILQRVMSKYDEGLHQIGVHLKVEQWFGPGQAAQNWMHNRAPSKELIYGCNEECKKKHAHFEQFIPDWYLESARLSYFGGWFEQMIHGIVPGISHEYDINSAYPFIIANMPCLLHGKYTKGEGIPEKVNGKFVNGLWQGDLCLVKATIWSPEIGTDQPAYIGTMLHRNKKGGVSRPQQTNGWYWYHELSAAIDAECVSREIEFYEWVKYEPCNCAPPLAEAQELYDLRLKVGKNTPIGIACKLVLNSMYGKFAQSIGNPLYGNSIYASLITAGCRSMILQAIASHPKGKSNVIMVATDAVYFLDEHPSLPMSKKLGEWGYEDHSNLTLWAPGFYWDDKTRNRIKENKSVHFKARGVSAKDFAPMIGFADESFKNWDETIPPIVIKNDKGIFEPSGDWPEVSYLPSFSMKTCLQALMQNDWALAGKVIQGPDNKPLYNSSSPHTKRRNGWFDKSCKVYRSEPWNTAPQSDTIEFESYTLSASTPYEKKFGLEDPFSEDSKGRYGLTQDGYVGDELRNVLLDK